MLDGSTSTNVMDGSMPYGGSLTRDALHARFIRRKRELSAWDAEEARDLRVAEALQLWSHFGCVTIIEYLEVFCGIEPRTALERVRVSWRSPTCRCSKQSSKTARSSSRTSKS
jgi:hypothetical protein